MRIRAHGAGAGRDAWRCAHWRAARHRCAASPCTVGPGLSSCGHQLGRRRGGEEAAHEFDDAAQARAIGFRLQQVELDLRLVARIGRTQRHLAAALRMQQHAGHRELVAPPLRQPGNHGRAKIDTGLTSICRSGRSRPGEVRTRPCAEIGERATMPLRNIFHCSTDRARRSSRRRLSKQNLPLAANSTLNDW